MDRSSHTSQSPRAASRCRFNACTLIEDWRREYNEERPKKGLGGLTPAYAKTLAKEASTVTAGL
jgi:hypothetical protein